MSESLSSSSTSLRSANRILPWMLILFVGSGCAALIYEIVWLQMLQLVIGSTAVSLGVLLGTFMGGMCLGSLLLPRIISAKRHPLRVYAFLEIGIGVVGIIVLFGIKPLESFYTSLGTGGNSVFIRGAIASICLLPPTLLMGATLPAIARWVHTTPSGVSWLGFFYGGNIVGAVIGCLTAGFFLLRVYDMAITTYVAVVLNFLVALFALFLASRAEYEPEEETVSEVGVEKAAGSGSVYLVIAMSGLCALGAEVVWTRLVSLMLGGTTYTFSIILGVFLMGLGIGSSVGSLVARVTSSPRKALGACQLLIAAGLAWTAYMLTYSVPYWPVDPSVSESPWYTFQIDIMRAIWTMLPAALLWGASFPLALAAVAAPGQDSGKLVGGVYAANTVGAIVGAVVFSMFLIPAIGTPNAQRVLIGLTFLSALIAFFPFLGFSKRDDPEDAEKAASSPALTYGLIGAVAICAALIIYIRPVPWGMVAFGRYSAAFNYEFIPGLFEADDVPSYEDYPEPMDRFAVFTGEGMNVSVAVTKSRSTGWQYFHGAGKVQASTDPQDMRLQRMLGHISALAHPDPKSVLVVACGAGVTAGSFIPYNSIDSIVICDIEPLVPTKVTPQFGLQNHYVVGGYDPEGNYVPQQDRVHVQFDDGRHFIRTTDQTFDIITSDPIDPWVKGCAALNTVEYYQMCYDKLNPGGLMSLWIPLYESDPETIKSVLTTFFSVFEKGVIWSNDFNREGYDAVLFGWKDPESHIDLDELQARFEHADYAAVRDSLAEVGFHSISSLLATYAGQASDLDKSSEWGTDAQINTDKNLRLQYLAGLSLNSYVGGDILDSMLDYYTFPEQIFQGSDAAIADLKRELVQLGRPQ